MLEMGQLLMQTRLDKRQDLLWKTNWDSTFLPGTKRNMLSKCNGRLRDFKSIGLRIADGQKDLGFLSQILKAMYETQVPFGHKI